MSGVLVVTGTDTEVGKTVVAAALTQALSAAYWKPVQSGMEEETDSAFVARMVRCHVLPEAYRLQLPASPHLSAEAEGVEIKLSDLELPQIYGPLVVEGAGGLMVPLNREALYVDLFAQWQAPVVLCASTRLGTINHTLLSLEALRARSCPVVGVIFNGDPEPEVEETICQFGEVRHLGRLPVLKHLSPDSLRSACAAHIDLDAIRKGLI